MGTVANCVNPHCEALILAHRTVCSECWHVLPLEVRNELRTYERIATDSEDLQRAVSTAARFLAARGPLPLTAV